MKEKHRSQLVEKYEDALFALMLSDLMQIDGVKWNEENERLKEDKSLQIPQSMREKSLRGVDNVLSKQSRRKTIRAARRILYRVALAFLVLFIAIAVPFCTASAFRQGILDLLIEKFEKETYVRIEPVMETTLAFELPWLPGENWIKTYTLGNEEIKDIRYEQETGEYIEYIEFLSENTNKTIDTENAQTQREFVGNKDVLFVNENDELIAIWQDENRTIYCELRTYGVEKSDIYTMIKLL